MATPPVRWETPPMPNAYRNRIDWPGIAETLRRRPGKWAHIHTDPKPEYAASMAGRVRTGVIAAMRPPGTFDAVSRTVDGEFRVYARYVGGEE